MKYYYQYVIPLLITIFSFFFTIIKPGLYNHVRYDRNAILSGEFWRVLTGNFTHADMNHWLINIASLWALWIIFSKHNKKPFILLSTVILASISVCLCLLFFEPQIKWYVGLSGALHGLFAAGIILSFKSEPGFMFVFAIFLSAKLLYEQLSGPLPGSAEMITLPVIVNSHLYGAISGIIIGIIIRKVTKS